MTNEVRKERFFKVIEGSPLHEKYFKWAEYKKKITDLANQILEEKNIETDSFISFSSDFYVRKGKLDYWIKKQLVKEKSIINGKWFYKFKQTSEFMKRWKELLLDNGIEQDIYKPSLEPYLKNIGKYEYRYFEQDGVIYYTQTNCGEWHDEECLLEISQEEYEKIMDDYDKNVLNAQKDEEK